MGDDISSDLERSCSRQRASVWRCAAAGNRRSHLRDHLQSDLPRQVRHPRGPRLIPLEPRHALIKIPLLPAPDRRLRHARPPSPARCPCATQACAACCGCSAELEAQRGRRGQVKCRCRSVSSADHATVRQTWESYVMCGTLAVPGANQPRRIPSSQQPGHLACPVGTDARQSGEGLGAVGQARYPVRVQRARQFGQG